MNIMQKNFIVKLAGLVIGIDTVSESACVLCRDYLYEGKPDLQIQITEADVEREFEKDIKVHKTRNSAETLALYRKIVEEITQFNTILMHGAVVAVDNKAYLFTAPSGTGKTTHIKLWLESIEHSYVVNGDKPLIRILDGKVYACGTPWAGNEGMNTNSMVELDSIIIMNRGDKNTMEKLSFGKAYPFLLQQTHIPENAEKAKAVLAILAQLHGKVKTWSFQFDNYKEDCLSVSYNTLVNG